MDEAISFLQERHPWMTYAEAVALIVDAYERNEPHNKYSRMTNTLMRMDIDKFGLMSEHKLRDRLARIMEWI